MFGLFGLFVHIVIIVVQNNAFASLIIVAPEQLRSQALL